MELAAFIFLSSGLFLGWSLGANDAANVFGTAVGSRMVRFTTAAIICSIFVALGAVWGGAGATEGLGKLGAVNALPGAFMVAMSAALTVYWMTKLTLPVSTSQAIVGAIIGWNLYSRSSTDPGTLMKIIGTWVACPILGAMFAALMYWLVSGWLKLTKPHMLRRDLYTRLALILAGAFGSYSLGANNIGNVMGVFVNDSPFTSLYIGPVHVTATQQLFAMGAIAIAVGVFTYSRRVMLTVGDSLMPLNPIAALVVVIAHSLVLYLFSSTSLESLLIRNGLPPLPLIPVSSSQAVIGAVIGIGLTKGLRGARQIHWHVLTRIVFGWISTPLAAALLCYVSLFFLANVFNQTVFQPVHYRLDSSALERLAEKNIDTGALDPLVAEGYEQELNFRDALREQHRFASDEEKTIIETARIETMRITKPKLVSLDPERLSEAQLSGLKKLEGESYDHRWQLRERLSTVEPAWRMSSNTREHRSERKHLEAQFDYVCNHFGF